MALSMRAKTEYLSASEPNFATLVSKHGDDRLWAGVKKLGFDADDFDRKAHKYRIAIDERVPKDKVPKIEKDRTAIWDALRQDRLKLLDETLETLNDDEVRHYTKCTVGVQPVKKEDLPPVDTLAGMDQFNDMQEHQQRKVKAEQARKARAMGMDFLMEKKKIDEANAKVKAFDKRMLEYRKAQQKEWEEKKKKSDNAAKKRESDAKTAAAERAEWEDEIEAKLAARMQGAKERRGERYSPKTIAAKLEANKQKRIAAFEMATQQEAEMLETMQEKQDYVAKRLEENQRERKAFLEARNQAAADHFQMKQIQICQLTTEWVNNKLKEHKDFKDKFKKAQKDGKTALQERTKATVKSREDRLKKWRTNHSQLGMQQESDNEALLERHHQADLRRQELDKQMLKNENDIFTFREVKHNTFGELTKRRQEEIKKRTDAQLQALVYKVAENQHKDKAKSASMVNLRDCRQRIAKESLTFQDQAYEGFLKIQSEPDESKVIGHMNRMGFDMPKLPKKDSEAKEEEAQKM